MGTGRVLGTPTKGHHNALKGRSDPECHPIDAITGLRAALEAVLAGNGAPVGNATPTAITVGAGSAGVALAASREDHQHPAALATDTTPGLVVLGPGGAQPFVEPGTEGLQGAGDEGEVGVFTAQGAVVGRPDFKIVDGVVTLTDLGEKVTSQAGTGSRGLYAEPDGTRRAEDKHVWVDATAPLVPTPAWGYTFDNTQNDLDGGNPIVLADGVYLTWAGAEPDGWFIAASTRTGTASVASTGAGAATLHVALHIDSAAGNPGGYISANAGRWKINLYNYDRLDILDLDGTVVYTEPHTEASLYLAVTLVSDGVTVSIYLDGVFAASFADEPADITSATVSTYAPSVYGTVGIADLFAWPLALDASQVIAVFDERATRPWSGVSTDDILDIGPAADVRVTKLASAQAAAVVPGTDGMLSARLFTEIHARGLLSARPAASAANAGLLYDAIDIGQVFISTGTTWEYYGPSTASILSYIWGFSA